MIGVRTLDTLKKTACVCSTSSISVSTCTPTATSQLRHRGAHIYRLVSLIGCLSFLTPCRQLTTLFL